MHLSHRVNSFSQTGWSICSNDQDLQAASCLIIKHNCSQIVKAGREKKKYSGSGLYPDSVGSVSPDVERKSGPLTKKTIKKELDVLSGGLEAPGVRKSFHGGL